MAFLGNLDLRLDPWQVDYGSELPASQPTDRVDKPLLDVERPVNAWEPLPPTRADRTPRLVFVDGVRRIEARLVARRGDRLIHGAFASAAVGSVGIDSGKACCERIVIRRLLVLDSGESAGEAVALGNGLVYEPVTTGDSGPEAPLARLQEEMRLTEERLALELADRADTLVVADGPLTFAHPVRGAAVGYVKTLHQLYVGPDQLRVMAALPPGYRTPLFRLTGRFQRYSWFLRLAAPHRTDPDLAGIVRLEVSDHVGLGEARRLADASAALLPAFAPTRGRDPRAPQNLLPIGALEQFLRRRMGDPAVVRRRISSLLAKETIVEPAHA